MKKRITIHSMKRLVCALMLLISGIPTIASETPTERLPFIEEGKIWWYEVGVYYLVGDKSRNRNDLVGIITKGETELDGVNWTECHMVDSTGNIVTTYPLALVREEGKKIYVTDPNLNDSYEEWERKVDAKGGAGYYSWLYTGFFRHKNYYQSWELPIDPEASFPALLYDFEWQEGDCFSWPWAWTYRDFTTQEQSPNEIWVKDKEENQVDGLNLTTWMIGNENGDLYFHCHNGKILDGIGLVSLETQQERNGIDIYHAGFFFNPAQVLPPVTTDMLAPKNIPPILTKVERPDGTVIYENPQSSVTDINADGSINNESLIYDLHGRVITNPQSGSVYIRNGKKFVAK